MLAARASRVLSATILATSLTCSGTSQPSPAGLRVLFIGNSLTYVNDLPGTFAALVRQSGDSVTVGSVAQPNLALIDHALGQSNAIPTIKRGGWSVVVMQQGPTRLAICRDTLLRGARLLDRPIRDIGANPALLMSWPAARDTAGGGFDQVRYSFQLAAQTVHGMFLPVGAAWRAAWNREPRLALYGDDDYHPGRLGTYLAALVLYERLTGRDARALPGQAMVEGQPLLAPEAIVRLLQEAAHEANQQFPAVVEGLTDSGPARPAPPITC